MTLHLGDGGVGVRPSEVAAGRPGRGTAPAPWYPTYPRPYYQPYPFWDTIRWGQTAPRTYMGTSGSPTITPTERSGLSTGPTPRRVR